MQKRSSKGKDINKLATFIVETATAEKPAEKSSEKNPHAQALGRLGGLKGGKARAANLSAKKRKEIAKKAANVRWSKSRS